MFRSVICLLLASLVAVSAFAPLQPSRVRPTPLTLLKQATMPSEADQARIVFCLWFFGSSGGAGIALTAFPKMYTRFRYIQELKSVGPTLGGPNIGINTLLCGYPEDIAIADVEKVVNNPLSIEQIVDRFPQEGNFLTEQGYLAYKAFEAANTDACPLAVRAVFDTFNASTDLSEPDKAQALIEEYKKDPMAVAANLLKAKLASFSSIGTLLFLLGLAAAVCVEKFKDGWFPDWPGLDNVPASLFNPETGLTQIPKYWLGD